MGVEFIDLLILLDLVVGDLEGIFFKVCIKEEFVKWNEIWNVRDGSVFVIEDKVFEEEIIDCDDFNVMWDVSDVVVMLVCEVLGWVGVLLEWVMLVLLGVEFVLFVDDLEEDKVFEEGVIEFGWVVFEVECVVKDVLIVLSCVIDDVEIFDENVDFDFDVEFEVGELIVLFVVVVFVVFFVFLLL